MFSLSTASGTVRITAAEPDDTGAVRYTLAGAVSGTVHAVATHHPSQWDEFTAVRVSLGAANSMDEFPAEPLPRVRSGRRAYHGSIMRLLNEPADSEWGWRLTPCGIQDTEDRDAPPKSAHTLETVMRACASNYAARPDLPRLFDVARRRETPKLRAWLAEFIPSDERDMRRSEQQAEQYRQAARQVTAAWWQAARWYAAQPSPLLALVLAPTRESLAHRANYLPQWAEIHDESAQFYRRRLNHDRTMADALRRPRRRSAAPAPTAV
ncbi:hypothetical protein SLUN_00025 [Streptomyces lunaelactis]|uniref:Uncharacterized protein n=1 Tax=Streptomyces lunaelactis TaxID=1535768 RepID=A0A2R4SVK2_9ACTN|nr:hypothetical protein [Streptomyces lunaelactis]AVZ70891.1 hypothetical protein SLUN_00025 [Streptomyces lunaelactis]NUK26902.1 hypothetical protein [Streptomyces lunaelactis]NUK89767.1 hypothetical protein [Streptomyces lunaelactis]